MKMDKLTLTGDELNDLLTKVSKLIEAHAMVHKLGRLLGGPLSDEEMNDMLHDYQHFCQRNMAEIKDAVGY